MEMTVDQGAVQLPDLMMRVQSLPIGLHHLKPLETMTVHHRDPFDRIPIAQCLSKNSPILSADAAFDNYLGLSRLW